MNSLYYGVSLFALLLILRWYVLNDGDGQNDGSIGLLAMKTKKAESPPAPPSDKRSFRRQG